jgi:hypothetical protein
VTGKGDLLSLADSLEAQYKVSRNTWPGLRRTYASRPPGCARPDPVEAREKVNGSRLMTPS